jgi:hypothetical protein
VVPFYNYLQAAFVLEEDGRLPAAAVVRVAIDLAIDHRFDGEALGRSYLDLTRRGHLAGTGALAIAEAYRDLTRETALPAAREIERMCAFIAEVAKDAKRVTLRQEKPDYGAMLERHGRRRAAP